MEVKCFIVLERKCALREGRKQLLENRNNELRCDDPVEAEAIVSLQLSKMNWYTKYSVRSHITVKQMKIDLLLAIIKYVLY